MRSAPGAPPPEPEVRVVITWPDYVPAVRAPRSRRATRVRRKGTRKP
jgi:hypothetical protein